MLAQSLKHIYSTVRALVHSPWQTRSAIALTVTLLARSAIKNLTDTKNVGAIIKTRIRPMVRAPVHSLWLTIALTTCKVSNQKSDRTADRCTTKNVGAIIKTRIKKISYGMRTNALAMASSKRDSLESYPTCTVSNQESDRSADKAPQRMLAQSFKTRT